MRPEFEPYREEFNRVVNRPNLDNERENSLRRALLFLRRGAMWRELPRNTEWYEVQLETADLARIRFFPRAQWRRVARGSFYLNEMVDCLRTQLHESPDEEFFRKLSRLSLSVHDHLVNPTVLLIGLDDTSPLTILDGNHRVAASMLASPPAALTSLRFICGFSPNMTRCCWYQTNVNTLTRYVTNLLVHLFKNPATDIGRLQQADL